jgi:serine/threonine/tyrosine-interacting protein
MLASASQQNGIGPPAGCVLGDQYTSKIPSAPLILFTLPNTDPDYGGRGIDLGPAYPGIGADFLPTGQQHRVAGLAVTHWRYEDRRSAQAVLPFLFIGPANFTRDQDFLRQNGITMLFGIKPSQHSIFITAPAQRSARELQIPCHLVDANSLHDMTALYKTAIPAINQHLTEQHALHQSNPQQYPNSGKVFIFCESGNHHSAALAAAYIMKTFQDVDHLKAMQCVLTTRFSCDFDDTMRQSLLTWNNWLEAERSVHEALKSPLLFPEANQVRLVKQKRSFTRDDDDDDLMEVDGEEDAERFRGRRMTPFLDE